MRTKLNVYIEAQGIFSSQDMLIKVKHVIQTNCATTSYMYSSNLSVNL